jgi:hypothetical protein
VAHGGCERRWKKREGSEPLLLYSCLCRLNGT